EGIRAVNPVLLDTGVIVALLDRNETYHPRCVAAIQELNRPLVTCEAVIAESCYLLRNCPGAAEAILTSVDRGMFQIPFQLSRSVVSVQRLLRKYREVPAGFADACLIVMAEELGTGEILTLDRDFEIYRWRGNRPFRLLVDLS